jgi:hypothetical protein
MLQKSSKEFMTFAGATELADKIRQFWAEKGHIVRAWIEVQQAKHDDLKKERTLYVVRSNLFNGLPDFRRAASTCVSNRVPEEEKPGATVQRRPGQEKSSADTHERITQVCQT